MSVTVSDILKLPSMRDARVAGGERGLGRIVDSVSVLEYAQPSLTLSELFDNIEFMGNELVITAFATIKDDVEAQCANIRRLAEVGEVGLVLYYVGIFLPRVDPRLIRLADELGFVLIVMPEGRKDLRYSELICEAMEAIFEDQRHTESFVAEILERAAGLPDYQRNINTVLRMVSDRIHASLILTDEDGRILNEAAWPRSLSGELAGLLPKGFPWPETEVRLGDDLFLCHFTVNTEENPLHLLVLHSADRLSQGMLRQAAEVVRLALNLWSRKHAEVAWRELVRAILQDEPDKMRRLARIFHIDVKSLHAMWILSGSPAPAEWGKDRLLPELTRFLSAYSASVLMERYEDSFVIFTGNPDSFAEEEAMCAGIWNCLEVHGLYGVSMTFCRNLDTTVDVREAFLEHLNYREDAGKIFPRRREIRLEELRFAHRCRETVRAGEKALEEAMKILRPLSRAREGKELVKTLQAFLLDAGSGTKRTAELLFVHVNTIKYRIQRCSELLGFRIGQEPETMSLYFAAALQRLLE